MSIVRKTDTDAAQAIWRKGNFDQVKCLNTVTFSLAELKMLIAAADAYNNTRPVGSPAVNDLKCRMILEQENGTNRLNMYISGDTRHFNLNAVSGNDVVLGKPCPPYCTTDEAAAANMVHGSL